ncbi:hypothetical protein [Natronoflexus pectinivorans]|uniref:Dolichyl-phosphate-mannose-protein mannosyltransferase n=1 Tax=Natronoflexus pectinivorans TaxID=682526 RepID=A0A4R2GJF1_9BACT|nr:hypothetical protein [Natronoflexus pectinivorans]TCO08861.1 hypothetical protein EV194_104172 [Natronoflexus pectinivorans]
MIEITSILKKNIVQKSIPLIIGMLIFIISRNYFFFWDTISQISIPANWYFDNNFKSFWVPDESTTGHLPVLPLYVAFGWSLLGKSIVITNLLFVPFVIGIIYQLKSLSEKVFHDNIVLQNLLMLLVLLDATLLSQLSMITPDTPHIFFYLLSINAILSNKRALLVFAVTLMGLVSMRGTMTIGGITIFYLLYQYSFKKLSIREISTIIFPVFIVGIAYGLHYFTKGWVVHNINSSNWSSSSELVDFSHLIKNIIVFNWQLADYGRIVLWFISFYGLYKIIRNKQAFDNTTLILLVLIATQIIIWFPITIAHKNPFGHRYFLPIIVLLPFLTLHLIHKYFNKTHLLTAISFIALTGGYFVVYPKKIAQGWDATPAHWSYYSLRKEMISYLDNQSIDKNNVSSFFPNLASSYHIDLDTINTFNFNRFNNLKSQYVFYSNVYNMSDEAIDLLFHSDSFKKKHILKKGQVYIILFERKQDDPPTPPVP